jgi:hypothetical protein
MDHFKDEIESILSLLTYRKNIFLQTRYHQASELLFTEKTEKKRYLLQYGSNMRRKASYSYSFSSLKVEK